MLRKLPRLVCRAHECSLTVVNTGELQRLQNLDWFDHTVELFMGIYGVGRSKALHFVMQGFRTLGDLLERGDLTESQKTGIELYHVCQPNMYFADNRILQKGFHEKRWRDTHQS